MRSYKIERSLRGACAAVLLMAVAAYAEPNPTAGNPDTDASDRNYDVDQPNSVPGGAQKAKDAGNRALNKVDEGVHKGIHKTKKGAKKAGAKTEEAIDDLSEPAKKPNY
jgi:hypothetical protein